jgi:hypothetical protein
MKKTIKRQIVEFVASKGIATRTEIIEFYVDLNQGEGTYAERKNHPLSTFRGHLSAGFNDNYTEKAWLMNKDTSEYLVRVSRGKYSAVIH